MSKLGVPLFAVRPGELSGRVSGGCFTCVDDASAQELCESRGGRPGLPVPNKPDGFSSGRKATLERCSGLRVRKSSQLSALVFTTSSLTLK